MNKLNITFCSFPDFAGNAKSLYEYMVKRYEDNMNYTWIVYNKETVQLLKEKNINAILIGTEEFKKYISKTNVFFTTHANLIGDKEKTKNSIYIELWHGIGPKPIGFLMENLSKEDEKWYNSLIENIDYLIVPSGMWKVIYSSLFNINARRILSLGLPLLNDIKYSDGKKNLSLVLNKNVYKYKKIIYYMPTFKIGCGRSKDGSLNEKNIFNLLPYKEEELIKYLKENNYLLCIKRHPSDEFNYVKIENENILNIDNDMLNKHNLDVNNILNAADILITDYSSVGTEFSFLDKPVIYIATDLEEYKNNRGIIFDDYDFWTEKEYCLSYKELIKKIDSNINHSKVAINKKLIFGNLKDGGCKEICDYMFDGNLISNRVKRFVPLRKKYEKIIKEKDDQISYRNERIEYLMEKEQELASIKFSRSYKIMKKVSNIRKKISNEKK